MLESKSIPSYIASMPEATHNSLIEIYNIIKKAVPEGTKEIINYGVPTFKNEQNIVHFGAAKTHIGFYPTPSVIVAFEEELKPYATSKGAVQFELDKALPAQLITKMVEFRLKQIEEKRPAT